MEGLAELWERADKTAVYGNREYNPGWHTALDLKHLLTVSEAITLSALDRKESRGGHFREDFPDKDAAGGEDQHRGLQGRGRLDAIAPRTDPRHAGGIETGHRGDEMNTVTFRIWRGDAERRQTGRLHDRSLRGHGRAGRRAQDPGHAGQRPRLPLELQGGQMRLLLGGNQRHAAA